MRWAGDGDRTGAAAKGREKGNSVALFSTPVMTWLGSEPIRHKYEKRSTAPRRRGLRLARDGFLFHKKTIASPCFAAPPFTQKVTLGSPVRLQAHSQRLAVATNLLRQVPLPTLAPIVKGMAAPSPFSTLPSLTASPLVPLPLKQGRHVPRRVPEQRARAYHAPAPLTKGSCQPNEVRMTEGSPALQRRRSQKEPSPFRPFRHSRLRRSCRLP